MECHACQRELSLAAGESLGFREECAGCRADLHVCLNCGHHDPDAYNECREPNAERVLDRERANRCEYFRPGSGGLDGGDGSRAQADAKAALEDLFRKG